MVYTLAAGDWGRELNRRSISYITLGVFVCVCSRVFPRMLVVCVLMHLSPTRQWVVNNEISPTSPLPN